MISVSSTLLGSIAAAAKKLTGRFAETQQLAIQAALTSANQKSSATIKSLKKECETYKAQSSEAQKLCDSLTADLNAFRKDYSTHVQAQKSYTQGMQANCVQLEARLTEATRQVMDLSAENTKCDRERSEWVTKYHGLKGEMDHVRDDLDKQILELQTRLTREQLDHEAKLKELEKKFKSQFEESDNIQLVQCRQSLAKKDVRYLLDSSH